MMAKRESRQREAVLGVLRKASSHPTADCVYDEVRKKIPNISKGTVYRNLKALRDAGEISELNLSGSISRYEGRQDSHYHFRCEACGRIFDLDEPVNEALNEKIARDTGFRVTGHRLEFRGLCGDCRNDKDG